MLVSTAWPAPAETTPQIPRTRKNVPTNSEMYAAGPLGSMERKLTRPAGESASPGWDDAAQESANATAKPSTVTSPAGRPVFLVASGIIESISITSSAPAAKPLMTARRLSEAVSASA